MDILGLLKELFSGVLYLFTAEGLKTLVMFVISGVLIYLAIKKDYEPALLLPIGFGAILANLPPVIDQVTGSATASVLGSEGFLTVLFNAGITVPGADLYCRWRDDRLFAPFEGPQHDLLRRGGAVRHFRHVPAFAGADPHRSAPDGGQ